MGAEIKRREHAERPVRQRSSTLIDADEKIDGTWWRMRRRSSARGLRESLVLVAISVIFFNPGSSWAQGPLEVQWKGGRLSVRAGKAELSKVVEEIARQLGIEVQGLEEESQRQELAAIGAAAAKGDQAALREALLSPDPTVATVAFQNLTELDPAVAEEAIASAAKSDQPVTRLKALRLLDQVSQADEDTVLSGLRDALRDQDPRVKVYAVQALAARGVPEAIEYLRQAFRDLDLNLKMRVIEAVAHNEEGLPLLQQATTDAEEAVRSAASMWLAQANVADQ